MLEQEIVNLLVAELNAEERSGGVVYLAAPPVEGGTHLEFPRLEIEVPSPAWLAFIDGKPNHDWGHPCRYLLIDDVTGRVQSYPAQFPPFRPSAPWHWRVVYMAPTLPGTTATA